MRVWSFLWLWPIVMHLSSCALPPAAAPTTVAPLPSATTRPTPAESPTIEPPIPSATTAPSPSITPSVTATALTDPTSATLDAAFPIDGSAIEAQMLGLVNKLRVEAGAAPYPLDERLSNAAREHSCDMATLGYIGHEDSQGRTVAERVPSDLPWQWLSESVAAGSPDPAVIVALWMDEPPDGWHRRNILDADRVVAGIGYCGRSDDPTGNQHYWTLIVAK